ncbi:hypothetical protein ASD11_13015 [Aeromicrobium sp. Root495]|uniref:TetR/AcrR family transcriptional regulator n=1 Tax=Aeromicrobium sp. Root495 TaxID=1736550 RepID=UPI0006F682A3|nr:TetR/AcrR family transcriptional regulator [Aeromicrobium sp. Root495]KQY60365.1 hypothetical protein ASD11_13015 [Aeromicrobium sp. Root495]
MTPAPRTRLSAEDRRTLVVAAATRAFSRSGYAATSTDVVAKEAGVSQPYVVRIFGTKLELFLEVFDQATARVLDSFTEIVASGVVRPDVEGGMEPLGQAYTDLVLSDRDVMQVMLHGFVAASEPAIGELARRRMGEIFDVITSTGCDEDQARDFVAHGMLINVMLALGVPEHLDESPSLTSLASCAFGPAFEDVRAVG